MFSRRHPFLFFILIFTAIGSAAILGLAGLLLFGSEDTDLIGGDRVGIIEINGMISEAKDTLRALKRFREDDAIKAVVLRIDSPGGVVGPSQEIYREVRKTTQVKQVIASMGAVAASGGYYVAAAANRIVANPGTITGSIGVIMGFANFHELLKKIGLTPVVVKSGEFKDIGSPVRQMTDKEKQFLDAFALKVHRQFMRDVAEGRKMAAQKVATLADGRIFTGEEALTHGLVDRLGNLEDAIQWAGELGGISGKISPVYAPKKKVSLIRYLTDTAANVLLNRLVHPEMHAAYR